MIGEEEIECSTTAVVLYDRGTKDKGIFPKANKSEEHTIEAMHELPAHTRLSTSTVIILPN